MKLELTQRVDCDCGHSFAIDAVGVGTDTDIVCPSCHKVKHLSQATVDRLQADFYDSIGDIMDEALVEDLTAQFTGAQPVQRAVIVKDKL